jgi:hypothetical protein
MNNAKFIENKNIFIYFNIKNQQYFIKIKFRNIKKKIF